LVFLRYPMQFNNDCDIKGLRQAGQRAARVLQGTIQSIRPGMTVRDVDENAGQIMRDLGVRSAPKLVENFPGNICISTNEIIAHGVPSDRVLRCGDRINLDVSVEFNGYFGDVAYSLIIGKEQPKLDRLCKVAKAITFRAVELSLPGTPVNHIARMIEQEARKHDFTVVKNLCSHGIGKDLHAYPANILNYYDPNETLKLEEGMVIAWEPFISDGACRAIESECDDWSLTTHNNSHVAQFEHTVLVTNNQPEILTVLD